METSQSRKNEANNWRRISFSFPAHEINFNAFEAEVLSTLQAALEAELPDIREEKLKLLVAFSTFQKFLKQNFPLTIFSPFYWSFHHYPTLTYNNNISELGQRWCRKVPDKALPLKLQTV